MSAGICFVEKSTCDTASAFLVPVVGVEPTRYRYHWILSPARLPIPSHRRIYSRRGQEYPQRRILYHIDFIKSRVFSKLENKNYQISAETLVPSLSLKKLQFFIGPEYISVGPFSVRKSLGIIREGCLGSSTASAFERTVATN